ncbi:3-oxoacyl-[acyl-carrier-protein] reductase FabG1 [Serratia rubidaea]|uniref:3-oxoacyl-[acyl-carrier-protein] reductase FabG1 n=1 Tax=Serratia rubidaea TaxID=61652 RepID=A0A3S4H321_SERRU|nr:3-oxoacyl-[acyl-carrier-protein] reductase FabG1 [Serratia rubidaea]
MSEIAKKNKQQRVLIVGGTSGIGLACAQAFAKAGSHVTVMARTSASIDNALSIVGENASGVELDVCDDQQVASTFASLDAFDHVVITTAATPLPTGSSDSIPLDQAYGAMNSKFWGAYRVARAVRINSEGSLTFISGILAARPTKTTALIGAINAALESLTKGLALEKAPIRVNAVSPGILGNASVLAHLSDEERSAIGARLPLKKIGHPDLVADAVIFLANNNHITGTTLVVDGGGSLV